MRLLRALLLAAAAATDPVEAIACTLCQSPQAVSIRARLLQPDLWFNLCAVALPLALLASVVAIIHFDPTGRRPR